MRPLAPRGPSRGSVSSRPSVRARSLGDAAVPPATRQARGVGAIGTSATRTVNPRRPLPSSSPRTRAAHGNPARPSGKRSHCPRPTSASPLTVQVAGTGVQVAGTSVQVPPEPVSKCRRNRCPSRAGTSVQVRPEYAPVVVELLLGERQDLLDRARLRGERRHREDAMPEARHVGSRPARRDPAAALRAGLEAASLCNSRLIWNSSRSPLGAFSWHSKTWL